jgi:hypothetical protein
MYYDVSWTVVYFDKNDVPQGDVEVEVTFKDDIKSALALIEAITEPNMMITLQIRNE